MQVSNEVLYYHALGHHSYSCLGRGGGNSERASRQGGNLRNFVWWWITPVSTMPVDTLSPAQVDASAPAPMDGSVGDSGVEPAPIERCACRHH